MGDISETVQEAVEKAEESSFNGKIALFVAVIATFMALCNVKAGNNGQAMQQAQAKAIDAWAYYQAKGTKQNLAESTAALLRSQLEMSELSGEKAAKLSAAIAAQEALSKRYGEEKEKIKSDASDAEKEYDELNVHDDQFDLADACMSVSIALAGIAALTKKHWLLGVAVIIGGCGALFGVAGFLKWHLHSELMSKLLG